MFEKLELNERNSLKSVLIFDSLFGARQLDRTKYILSEKRLIVQIARKKFCLSGYPG